MHTPHESCKTASEPIQWKSDKSTPTAHKAGGGKIKVDKLVAYFWAGWHSGDISSQVTNRAYSLKLFHGGKFFTSNTVPQRNNSFTVDTHYLFTFFISAVAAALSTPIRHNFNWLQRITNIISHINDTSQCDQLLRWTVTLSRCWRSRDRLSELPSWPAGKTPRYLSLSVMAFRRNDFSRLLQEIHTQLSSRSPAESKWVLSLPWHKLKFLQSLQRGCRSCRYLLPSLHCLLAFVSPAPIDCWHRCP